MPFLQMNSRWQFCINKGSEKAVALSSTLILTVFHSLSVTMPLCSPHVVPLLRHHCSSDLSHSEGTAHPAAAVHRRHFGFSRLQATWQKPRSGRDKRTGTSREGSSLGFCSLFCTLVIGSFPRRHTLERFYPSNNGVLITGSPHSRCPYHLVRRNLKDAENN